MVISVKIQNFSRSRMTKQTVGIVSGNLATTSNFVEFRHIRNFTFFEARRGVRDTWHFMSGQRGTTCQAMGKSNMSSSVGHR